MIFHRCSILLLIIFSCLVSYGQSIYTINGFVKDSTSGEGLVNAHLGLKGTSSGTISNQYGFFSLTLPEGQYTIIVSVLGYRIKSLEINLTKNTEKDIFLTPISYQLNEVILEDKSRFVDIDPLTGAYRISPNKIKEFPRLGGEPDLLKILQTLPGIQQGNEGSAGLHVRGGSPDQNLILVDGVPVYNVFHLFGFLSVFNADVVKDVKVYKEGIPASYEGRLSSVVDISLKEGNLKNSSRTLNISPVAGSFSYEAPIKKDKSSIAVSGRRTWFDGLLLLLNSDETKTALNFHDVSAKYYSKINNYNNIYFSYYSSRDKFFTRYNDLGTKSHYSFDWQNHTGLVRWNRIVSQKAILVNSMSFSKYNFNQNDSYSDFNTQHIRNLQSFIQDINLTSSIDIFPNPRHSLNIGSSISHQSFQPEVLQPSI
jgi:hypothetical protein